MTELAGCNTDDSRHENKHQGGEQWEKQSCLAMVLGLVGKRKLFSLSQSESMFHFIKEKQPPICLQLWFPPLLAFLIKLQPEPGSLSCSFFSVIQISSWGAPRAGGTAGTQWQKGPIEQLWGRGDIPSWVQQSKYDQPQILSCFASSQQQQKCCTSPCLSCPFWAPSKTLRELRKE